MSQPSISLGDRGDAAVKLLSLLYPDPLHVEAAQSAKATSRVRWLAIPDARNPRILIPADAARPAVQAMRRQLTGQRVRTRIARTGLTFVIGSGLPKRMARFRLAVIGDVNAPSIEDPLREVLGVDDLLLTMPVGPARANRKPVLQLTDQRGTVLAFAKVGHNDLTRRLVDNEADSLKALEAAKNKEFRAPRPIAVVSWEDLSILVMEPLIIPSDRLTDDAARRRLVQVVAAIAATGEQSRPVWSEHPHRATLQKALDELGDQAARLRDHLDALDTRHGATEVPTGAWHGDLNSGNFALVAGQCLVWDWERYETGVPHGYDLLHHDLQQAVTTEGASPLQVATSLLRNASTTLAPLGVKPDAADVVATSYLLTLAARYLVDQQADAGASLGNVESWLVPALDEQLTKESK